jgi:hypothetical protein
MSGTGGGGLEEEEEEEEDVEGEGEARNLRNTCGWIKRGTFMLDSAREGTMPLLQRMWS